MNRYFKILDNDNNIIAFGIGLDGEEISESEYMELCEMANTKLNYANDLINGNITVDDIPEEFRSEIYNNVLPLISDDSRV